MSNEIIRYIVVIIVAAAFLCLAADGFDLVQQQKSSETTFKDAPQARALYKKMNETIRKAETLSYESSRREMFGGDQQQPWTYKVWMKKPNFFYVEMIDENGKNHGILVGDGEYAWSFWPNGRPWFKGEDYDAYQKSRLKVYMNEPAPPGKYSIGYAKILQKSVGPIIINPAVFQGINDTLEPVIDWMQNCGTEKIDGEDCHLIEVSYANHQRSQYFWISKRDNLPRKLKDVVRANEDSNTQELWSKVKLNDEIPQEKFRCTPPEGWKQWHPPKPEDRLLKPGQQAPDFELLSIDGSKIKMSDYRGKVVWLNFWRVGCPPCREEIPHLERLYNKYKSQGLAVLGFDFVDDKQIALDFLRQHSVTFPNIVDTSDEAIKTGFMRYGARAAPVNYIIGGEGKITAAWHGYDPNSTQAVDVFKKLGLE
jgi:peroxiredoxin/outer membrane lipoprotein-sorting protein